MTELKPADINALMQKLIVAAGGESPALFWAALQGLLFVGAWALPDERQMIRESMRNNLKVLDALGDTTGDEASAIVQRETAKVALDGAGGQVLQ
jgi:hypothetical protein